MKRNLLVATLGALAMGALFSMSASAQTCEAPFAWQPPTTGDTISATTCGQEDENGGGFCGGNFGAPGPAYVIQSTFDGTRTFNNVTISDVAGFGGAVYMSSVANGCGANAACGPTGSPGAPIPTADVQDGSWFIIVTAADFDGVGACGTFTLTSDGSFPVTLQDFSII